MSDVVVAERFLVEFGKNYRDLLHDVEKVCDEYGKSGGPGLISDIYSRSDSTGGDHLFKEPHKIVDKVLKKRDRVSVNNIFELNDIVGLTVVFFYSDQMKKGVADISEKLALMGIEASDPKVHLDKKGYYATHVVTARSVAGNPITCEIQFKTMLHDAWSAKMHDLTYKPAGLLDPRLSAMMGLIAQNIESLEKQSVILRNMIQSSWNVELETRKQARAELFTGILKRGQEGWGDAIAQQAKEVSDKLDACLEQFVADDPDGPVASEMTKLVRECCNNASSVRFGWTLAGRMAGLRSSGDLNAWFGAQADAWMAFAPELLEKGEAVEHEIAAVPLMFYVLGSLDRAIDMAQRLLADKAFEKLPQPVRDKLEFNRLSFIVEREYHNPTSNPERRNAIRQEIEAGLAKFEGEGFEDKKAAVVDTKGLFRIAFGTVQDDIRTGIGLCMQATSFARENERSITDAYSDLNLRLGWRRYFEIEALLGAE